MRRILATLVTAGMLFTAVSDLDARRKRKQFVTVAHTNSDQTFPQTKKHRVQHFSQMPLIEEVLPFEEQKQSVQPQFLVEQNEMDVAGAPEFEEQIFDMLNETKDESPDPLSQQGLEFVGQTDQQEPTMLEAPQAQESTPTQMTDQSPEDVEEEVADIYLNFENAELASFINYIADLKKINVIPDKGITGNKISLTIRNPLTKSGAWRVFLTIIEMAGFSITQVGDVYTVIPKAQKLRQPLPSFINVPLESLPSTDENIRYVTFLENIGVRTIKDIITGMLGVPNTVIDQADVNGLIITARSNDIISAMRVVKELDQTGLQESVVVMRLKQANARDVKELFDSLMQKPKGHPLARLLGKQAETATEYFPPTTKLIAEERTNSLILLGSVKSIQKIEKFITENIDTQLQQVESPLHIYELEYADASQVAEILQHVTSPHELETQAGQQAAKYGAVRGGVKYFKNMKYKVDKEGNRLIVSSTDKQDWDLLKKTIQDLDKAQPQVAIETLIVTVDIRDNKQLGAQLRNKRHGMLGKHLDIQTANITRPIAETNPNDPNTAVSLLGNLLSALTASLGSTVLTFGKAATGGVWGAFQMIKEISNTSILSQPFLTVANKATSAISVGETRRIPIQQAIDDNASIGDTTGFESKKAQTRLEVTPQINIDGIIKFDIDINIEDFLNDRGDTQVKKLKTSAMVADGQVLVLGGFVKTKVTESASKTPLLHRIPLLGWMFKNKGRNITKEYVFVFMCPTIVKPRQHPGLGLYTKMKLHEATNDVDQAIETKNINDPIHNWFFNPEGENYSHKVVDFSNARYQPTTVDIANDPYYRSIQELHHEQNKVETLFSHKELQKVTEIEPQVSAQNETPESSHIQVPVAPEYDYQSPTQQQRPTPIEEEPLYEEITYQPYEQPITETNQLDEQLIEKRNQLKQLLQQNPVVSTPQSDTKREMLRQFITSQPEGDV